jgi:hypothetical protein
MSTTAEDRSPGQVLCTSSGTPQANCTYVHHAKPTLTVTFHRFYEAPVGRMARTGLCSPGAEGNRHARRLTMSSSPS